MDLADVVTRRIVDLEAWTLERRRAVEGLPKATAQAAKRFGPHLLAAGLRNAPRHTGALRRSLRVAFRRTPKGMDVALTSDDPAALIQETGGTIRASSRRDMTVPIGQERAMWDATGTRRRARDVAGLFKIRARNGRVYLATREGGSLVLRFQLRKQVRQDGQGWASQATAESRKHMEPQIRAVFVSRLLGGGEHRP